MTRVAFDVTPRLVGQTGVSRYLRELDAGLGRHGVELLRFAIGRGTRPPVGTRWVRAPLRALERSWSITDRPRLEHLLLGRGPADLAHTSMVIPTRLPWVATVHDLAPLEHPHLHPPRHQALVASLVAALRERGVAAVVSATTGDKLIARGVPAERVVVTPNGCTALPEPTNPGIAAPFVLVVGETSARKNLPLLIRAFDVADVDGVRLVVAGPRAAGETDLARTATEVGLGDRLVRMTDVDDGVLAGLYRDALVLAFPSSEEGFGLPVLEAMSVGTPVLASDLPVLREVGADVARYVAEPSVEAWSAALTTAVRDAATRRRETSASGPLRAAHFSWDNTAAATIAAYDLALVTE